MANKQIPVITEEQLRAFNAKADARREEILNTPNMEIPAGSAVYYLSPNGNDNNDGRSPATAWKTIARLKAAEELPYGAYVCFERGGMWRGKFEACPGVTYTAYGEGPKPELRGCTCDGAVDGWWDEVAPSIWRYSIKFTGDVGMIVMNHGEENAIKMLMDYSGEQARELVSQRVWNGYVSLEKNGEFVHDLGDRWIKNANPDGGYVYLYCDKGNPATVWNSIEFIDLGAVISVHNHENVTVDNLCIKYTNFGVIAGTVNSLHIRNCEIGWIGGCVMGYWKNGVAHRYGNGVEIYGGCRDFVCDHNWVYQCYDAGLTHQYQRGYTKDIIMDGMYYTNNLIEKCVYNIEYFLGAPAEDSGATCYMANFYIRNNILLDAGGFGTQRPDTTTIASIKGWDHLNLLKGEFIIEDNLLVRSDKMMIHTGYYHEGNAPLYRNNIFVQFKDGQWGRNGVGPTKLQMYTPEVVGAEEYAGNTFYVIE